MEMPDAGTKLRMVLDYLPCEACLAQPVADQDLLCSLCARLDREVAIRVGARTTVLVERPSTPDVAPVVIPPAAPMPEAPAPREVVIRWADEPSPARPGSIEVVVEPLAAPAPPAPVVVAEAPAPAPAEAPVVEEPEEAGFAFDDVAEYLPPKEDFFDFAPAREEAPRAPARAEPEPLAALQPAPEPEPPQDDFVFRPPSEEAPIAEPAPAPEMEIVPAEEIPVETPERDAWAPPSDLLPEEPVVQREEPREAPPPEPSPYAPPPEEDDEVVEMEPVVEDEEVVEMELVQDEPAPAPAPAAEDPMPAAAPSAGASDLYRLRGFDAAAESALSRAGITEIAHLSGHDAGDLAAKTALPFERVRAWVQVADLVHEVGVPVDAAVALVAAGVAGPRGLRDADPQEISDRVAAFGGHPVAARDVARWKRRA